MITEIDVLESVVMQTISNIDAEIREERVSIRKSELKVNAQLALRTQLCKALSEIRQREHNKQETLDNAQFAIIQHLANIQNTKSSINDKCREIKNLNEIKLNAGEKRTQLNDKIAEKREEPTSLQHELTTLETQITEIKTKH